MQESGSKLGGDVLRCPPSLMSMPPKPPIDNVLKCPRCDSYNTKFCYYNNYSLSQPRHFCKSCRRYWTKGGALRNVPVGGGCRKNKRIKQKPNASSTAHQDAEAEATPLPCSDNLDSECCILPDNISDPTTYGLMAVEANRQLHFRLPAHCTVPPLMPALQSGHIGLGFTAPIRPAHGSIINGAGEFNALLDAHLPKESFALALDSLNAMNHEVQWRLQHHKSAMPKEEGQEKLQALLPALNSAQCEKGEGARQPPYRPALASFSDCVNMEEGRLRQQTGGWHGGQEGLFEGDCEQSYWSNGPWPEFSTYGASTSPFL